MKSIVDTYLVTTQISLDAMVTYLITKLAGRLLYYALNNNKRFKENNREFDFNSNKNYRNS